MPIPLTVMLNGFRKEEEEGGKASTRSPTKISDDEFSQLFSAMSLAELGQLDPKSRTALMNAHLKREFKPLAGLLKRSPAGVAASTGLKMFAEAKKKFPLSKKQLQEQEAIKDVATRAVGEIMRARRIRITNETRHRKRLDDAEAAGVSGPRQGLRQMVAEQVVPGALFNEKRQGKRTALIKEFGEEKFRKIKAGLLNVKDLRKK